MGGVWAADEAADRTAIEGMVRVFSMLPGRAGLYTADFDGDELARFRKAPAATVNGVQSTAENAPIPITIEGVPGTLVISKAPMGEADWLPPALSGGPSVLTIKKIRFIAPDVAMVDVMGKIPGLIVMKRVGTDWKIASLRRLAED